MEKVGRSIKSDASHDRDANGEQTRDDSKNQHRPMSEEEFQQYLLKFSQLSAFKEHKWSVDWESHEKFNRILIVKDNLGNVIRVVPESELWDLSLDDNEKKGHLFSKSA